MSKHTKEPWSLGEQFTIHDPTTIDVIPIRGPLGELIAEVRYPDRKPGPANAARIVACVNACASLPDPSVVGRMVEVLKEAATKCCNCDHGCIHDRARAIPKEIDR